MVELEAQKTLADYGIDGSENKNSIFLENTLLNLEGFRKAVFDESSQRSDKTETQVRH